MQYVLTRPYADGVQNPYADQVHLYPTTVHGPDYSWPRFDFPYVLRPYRTLDGLGGDGPTAADAVAAPLLVGLGAGLAGIVGAMVGEGLAEGGRYPSGRIADQEIAKAGVWGGIAGAAAGASLSVLAYIVLRKGVQIASESGGG